MKMVQIMTHDPMRCLGCGNGNTPDGVTGDVGPYIDLEHEIGWNDHAYFCMDCGTKVGAMAGMVSKDEYQNLRRSLRSANQEIHGLKAHQEETQRRLAATQERLLKVDAA